MGTLKKNFTIKRSIAIIVCILVIIFAFQNMHSVTINFIFFSMKFPLLFLILVLFLLGMFSGWMVKQKDIKKTIESVKDGLK
ncbi:DUF1049 domain-containing protein [Enterococcus faecalis]|nr:DUF1049 domain-containing protein [Enterococcus faecalis]